MCVSPDIATSLIGTPPTSQGCDFRKEFKMENWLKESLCLLSYLLVEKEILEILYSVFDLFIAIFGCVKWVVIIDFIKQPHSKVIY